MRRVGTICAAVAGVLAIGTGCGSSGSSDALASPTSPATSTGTTPAVTVVAIGDSGTTGVGDATGRGWVGRYGDLLQARLGRPVGVENLAAEGQTTDQLRTAVEQDAAVRDVLKKADVVLVGIGGADLNAGDDALSAGSCRGRVCYTPILRRYDSNVAAIAHDVRALAPHALLRAVGPWNGFPGAGTAYPPFSTAELSLYQALSERRSVCRAVIARGGGCVDVLRAFNGPRGDRDAYATGLMTKDPCCYPSGEGQQLIARLLLASGVRGLTPAG
jgi:lysophospholipase L1-like esterase